MKFASDILTWGKIKPFFDKEYKFNTIDIETIDNELFLLGFTKDNNYHYVLDNFYNTFHDLILDSARMNKDILTWSRYDNTHLIKMIIVTAPDVYKVLERIGKVTPIYSYDYNDYKFTITNIIKDSILFTIKDKYDREKKVTVYNLKNLYQSDLEKTAKNYQITFYSKLGIEYHIIDKNRFESDLDYFNGVIESNKLDNLVLIEIATKMLESFKHITGVYPKTIFTNGSISRSYLLSYNGVIGASNLQFKSMFKRSKLFDKLLDYSMRAYHGGKIESYVLGYIKKGKIIDITSAYPFAMSMLPKPLNKVSLIKGDVGLDKYYYAFIKCNIYIDDMNFIHPIIIPSPTNLTNISPYGYMKEVIITKVEYDYLKKHGKEIEVIEYVGVEHDPDNFPFKNLIYQLFNERMRTKKSNPSVSEMNKTILNSLYGINFELTDVYIEKDDMITWAGYRAGDYFNPVIASYITAIVRTYLSDVSYNIVSNGGEVYLNMTDSIIYNGDVTLDVFSDEKILGKFEMPTEINDIYILGAGRYEFKNEFDEKFTIKNRGFSVSVKDKGFYNQHDLNDILTIDHKTFVTSFKATTKKYGFEKMGHLIDDDYKIDPFNLGGKRFIENRNVNLNKGYTRTLPVYIEKSLYD